MKTKITSLIILIVILTGTLVAVANYHKHKNDKKEQVMQNKEKLSTKALKDLSITVIYDNNLGNDDEDDPTTEIGGGSIVIHSKEKHEPDTKTKQNWNIETFINNIRTNYLRIRNNPEELLSNVMQKITTNIGKKKKVIKQIEDKTTAVRANKKGKKKKVDEHKEIDGLRILDS